MVKRILGLIIIGILLSVFMVNIILAVREKQEAESTQESIFIDFENEAVDVASEGLSEGEIPPDFELVTLDGEKIQLSALNGKKVLLNFWTTWCPHCKAEMPHMENFYQKKAEEHNVEIIAVNLSSAEHGGNIKDKVETFVDEYELSFTIPLDEDGEVRKRYGIISIPTSYFIKSNGIIHKKVMGPLDEEMIERIVLEMK